MHRISCPIFMMAVILLGLLLAVSPGSAGAQTQQEFRDEFNRIEIRGGKKCTEDSRTVCLPETCEIDFGRTYSTSVEDPGGYGRGGPGYGVVVNSANTNGSEGYATYVLDVNGRCLYSKVKVCAKNQQRGWYEGYHVIYGKCYAMCGCPDGHWYDKNRRSCVTTACAAPGIPDGDKGGGYFAWQGTLFKDTPCQACGRLDQSLNTGSAQWAIVTDPDPATQEVRYASTVTPNIAWASVPGASWIGPGSQRGTTSQAQYVYQTTFCLCRGFANAVLSLQLLADNNATVILNGNTIGSVSGTLGFQSPPKPFSTNVQSSFKPGMNTLRIVVRNEAATPTGLSLAGTIQADKGRCQ